MSIVVTPIPRLTAFAAPALTLGTANAAGVADTTIATDSTLLVFDTTLPAAVGTAATGSAVVTARRDHVHAGESDTITFQYISYETGAVATGTTQTPNDDTIPTITEGTQFLSRTITPLFSDSRLMIQVTLILSTSLNHNLTIGLHNGGNAVATAVVVTGGDEPITSTFSHLMTSGGTSELTFTVRAGGAYGGSWDLNGVNGARRAGGTYASSIRIWEMSAA